MKRVGVFGGTFDPPHAGHLAVARAVLDSGAADEVWMMVSPRNPFKADRVISPEADRLNMTRLAVDSLPEPYRSRITVSDFETRLPIPTYTVTTLRALSAAYPDIAFRLIVGGDNLSAFSRWKNPEEIISDYGLIVYPRPGDSEWEKTYIPSGCVIIKDVPLYPVSSTELRRVAEEEPAKLPDLLPGAVGQYIIQNGLYGKR